MRKQIPVRKEAGGPVAIGSGFNDAARAVGVGSALACLLVLGISRLWLPFIGGKDERRGSFIEGERRLRGRAAQRRRDRGASGAPRGRRRIRPGGRRQRKRQAAPAARRGRCGRARNCGTSLQFAGGLRRRLRRGRRQAADLLDEIDPEAGYLRCFQGEDRRLCSRARGRRPVCRRCRETADRLSRCAGRRALPPRYAEARGYARTDHRGRAGAGGDGPGLRGAVAGRHPGRRTAELAECRFARADRVRNGPAADAADGARYPRARFRRRTGLRALEHTCCPHRYQRRCLPRQSGGGQL